MEIPELIKSEAKVPRKGTWVWIGAWGTWRMVLCDNSSGPLEIQGIEVSCALVTGDVWLAKSSILCLFSGLVAARGLGGNTLSPTFFELQTDGFLSSLYGHTFDSQCILKVLIGQRKVCYIESKTW